MSSCLVHSKLLWSLESIDALAVHMFLPSTAFIFASYLDNVCYSRLCLYDTDCCGTDKGNFLSILSRKYHEYLELLMLQAVASACSPAESCPLNFVPHDMHHAGSIEN